MYSDIMHVVCWFVVARSVCACVFLRLCAIGALGARLFLRNLLSGFRVRFNMRHSVAIRAPIGLRAFVGCYPLGLQHVQRCVRRLAFLGAVVWQELRAGGS